MDLSQKHFSQLRTLFLSLLLFATLGSGVAFGQFERNSRLWAGQGSLGFNPELQPVGVRLRLSPLAMRFFTDRWAVGVGGTVGFDTGAWFPQFELSLNLVTRWYLHQNDEARWCPFLQLEPGFGQAWGQRPPPSNQGGIIEDIYAAGLQISGGIGVSRFLTPQAGIEVYARAFYGPGADESSFGENAFRPDLQAGFFLLLPGEGWR